MSQRRRSKGCEAARGRAEAREWARQTECPKERRSLAMMLAVSG